MLSGKKLLYRNVIDLFPLTYKTFYVDFRFLVFKKQKKIPLRHKKDLCSSYNVFFCALLQVLSD